MSGPRTYLLPAVLALGLATAVLAQDGESDRGFLTGYIEDNLSGPGQVVRLDGFAGALSSRATFTQLTIADDDGVWLTIRDGAISWNRAALLRGAVDVAELSASEIDIARLPQPVDTGLPEAEALPFHLPELPVSIDIGSVLAEKVHLGAPVIGAEVLLKLDGSLTLSGGEGAAMLGAQRIDGTDGSLTLDARFVNQTDTLTLDLALSEPRDGIAATLLNLPGRPAMDLSIKGGGPLSDFAAEIALSSDGEPRLGGSARLSAVPDTTPPARQFELDLSGDLAPLFLPDFQPFFGPDVRLLARGSRSETGETRLDTLELEAAALSLKGSATLAADGLPQAFDFDAELAAPQGGQVRLPVAGAEAALDAATVRFSFDATAGDSWQGRAQMRGLTVNGDSVARADLTAEGQIARDPGGRRIDARISLTGEGIAPSDPALAGALGPTLDAVATVAWRDGQPLQLSDARIRTETALLNASGQVGDLAEGLPFDVQGTLNLPDLGAFSDLAGQPLGGRLILSLNGTTYLLDGRFDLRAGGAGRALSAGIEPLDRLLSGQSRIALDARRDETGITLRRLALSTDSAGIDASGTLRTGGTALDLAARLDEAGQALPGLQGAAAARARLNETAPGVYAITASAEGPGQAAASFEGELRAGARGALTAEGTLRAGATDLGAYAEAAGRRLSGAVTLSAEGSAALADRRYDLTVDLSGKDLALGEPMVDRLLGGQLSLRADAAQEGDTTTVSRFALSSGEVSAEASGTLIPGGGRIEGAARLRNLALLAPDFSGPLSVTGAVTRAADGSWGTDLHGDGPGGTTAEVTGTLAADAATVNVALNGEAPLGLANAFIAPRAVQGRARFDLRLDGAPALAALSGRVTTSGARLVAPTYGVALTGIEGGATLSGGSAQVDISGGVEGGGRASVAGSVGLIAPNAADLRITLTNARITDPKLYETRVSGALNLTGPLTAGGLIAGRIDVGETEIRVNPTGLGTGDIPEGMRHLNETRAGYVTRARAGLIAGAGSGGGGRPLGLDLLIRAPNRIFVRGRGLDAELGGGLRLSGTTDNILPQGQFELIRGRLDILGRRLAFDRGSARLEGSFDPYINLVATTQADDITVSVIVDGPASEPAISFQSAPELPEDEVLARLIFGKSITELSPLQAARLASAVAQLTGTGGGGIVDRLRQNFGLDDLDVTTGADGNAAVRAGRYISDKVYSEVTVDSQGKADISLNLDLSSSVKVKGTAGSDGETGVGIFYERDY